MSPGERAKPNSSRIPDGTLRHLGKLISCHVQLSAVFFMAISDMRLSAG
jgi:hypothetical protein